VSSHAHTIPTNDHKNPAVLRGEMTAELTAKYTTITLANTAAGSIREAGSFFEVDDVAGRTWRGRKVILATGSQDVLPDTPGYKEAWGKSM
jgi:gliotoxin/aspirochlorine biosynthesis thioredoxin reductase